MLRLFLRFLCCFLLISPLLVSASKLEPKQLTSGLETVPDTMQGLKMRLTAHLDEWNAMKPALKRLIKAEQDLTMITATLTQMSALAAQPTEKQLLEPQVFSKPIKTPALAVNTTPAKVSPQLSNKKRPIKADKIADKAVSNARFGIHLASYSKNKYIKRSWNMFQEKFPEQLAGKHPYYYQLMIQNNTYTRLVAGPYNSRKTAQNACKKLKEERNHCQVLNYEVPN